VSSTHPGTRRRSTPKARQMARARGIDLRDLPDLGRPIRSSDLLSVGAAQVHVQAADLVPPTAPTARSSTAWSMVEVDFTNVQRSITQVQSEWVRRIGSPLTAVPYVLRATAMALATFPYLNAELTADGLRCSQSVNLGIAVDSGSPTLGTAVLTKADGLGVGQLAVQMHRILNAVRSGGLEPGGHDGGAFEITCAVDSSGVLTMPALSAAKTGALAIAEVRYAPSVVPVSDGSLGIAIRPRGTLCLAWDARAINGAYAAHFLGKVKDLIEATDWTISLPE